MITTMSYMFRPSIQIQIPSYLNIMLKNSQVKILNKNVKIQEVITNLKINDVISNPFLIMLACLIRKNQNEISLWALIQQIKFACAVSSLLVTISQLETKTFKQGLSFKLQYVYIYTAPWLVHFTEWLITDKFICLLVDNIAADL